MHMVQDRRAPANSSLHLLRQTLDGNRRALSRLITLVETAPERFEEALSVVHLKSGRAMSIGITGFPGAGKSTLVDKLIAAYRAQGKTVAVLAVDPSSPFSGGAILGDRIRMTHGNNDAGVFIRSLGTRGHLGGLSRSTRDVMKILDAFGFDLILLETVGTGQSEVEVVRLVDTCCVVVVPGLGDDIQAIKAGILEIADLLVINKRDHAGADRTRMELEGMLAMGANGGNGAWYPEVVMAQANANLGVDDLVAAIARHHDVLTSSRELQRKRRQRCRDELLDQMTWALRRRAEAHLDRDDSAAVIRSVEARLCAPARAARSILAAEFDRITPIREATHVRPNV